MGDIGYVYNATRVKLEKRIDDNGDESSTQYDSGFIYENNELQYFNHPEGYVKNENNVFSYIYQYKDHLGNVRLSYADANNDGTVSNNEIIEESNYYPFGMKHKGYNTNVTSTNIAQKIKYQEQERQDELGLNWDSFKWRNYDYAIGRFFNIDPLAEKYYYNGAYNFSENRVIDGRELEGLEWVGFSGLLGTSNTPPGTSTGMNLIRVGTEASLKTSEVVGKTAEASKVEIHHVIPRQLKNTEIVRTARDEGFKFEGAENKIPLPKFNKSTGTGRHGPHPKYNSAVKEKLEAGPPEGVKPIDFIKNLVSETIEVIKSNPETKVNDLFRTEVIQTNVIESTKVSQPELPRRITPKMAEPKSSSEDKIWY